MLHTHGAHRVFSMPDSLENSCAGNFHESHDFFEVCEHLLDANIFCSTIHPDKNINELANGQIYTRFISACFAFKILSELMLQR